MKFTIMFDLVRYVENPDSTGRKVIVPTNTG